MFVCARSFTYVRDDTYCAVGSAHGASQCHVNTPMRIPANDTLNDIGAHAVKWSAVRRVAARTPRLETAAEPAASMHQHRLCA